MLKNIEEIIKEFEDKFVVYIEGGWVGLGEVREPSDELTEKDPEKYIDFLRTALTEYKEGIKEGLPKDRERKYTGSAMEDAFYNDEVDGHNQALKKVRNYLETL